MKLVTKAQREQLLDNGRRQGLVAYYRFGDVLHDDAVPTTGKTKTEIAAARG